MGYQRSWLSRDLTAGALIVAIAIPLSMGMAEVVRRRHVDDSDIDVTAARMLEELHDDLASRGIRSVLVELLADLETMLERAASVGT